MVNITKSVLKMGLKVNLSIQLEKKFYILLPLGTVFCVSVKVAIHRET